MSEDEKKAIEHLNDFLNIPNYIWIKERKRLIANVKIALNLIENQEKYLKREKERTQETIKYGKFYKQLYNDVVKKRDERYIPKDKIREKIKKYEEINMDVFTFEVAEDLKELLEEE